MIDVALIFAFGCLGFALLMNLWRLALGPTMMDRILTLDTMMVNSIALIVLFGIAVGRAVYFETAMLFAMVGFISTVAFCKFLLRGGIIE